MITNNHLLLKSPRYSNLQTDYWLWHGAIRPIKSMIELTQPSIYQNEIVIPSNVANFLTIHELIRNLLQEIECLQFIYDPCCWHWRLIYGTEPLKRTLTWPDQYQAWEKKNEMLQEEIYRIRLTLYLRVSPHYFKRLGISLKIRRAYDKLIYEAVRKANSLFPDLIDGDWFDFEPPFIPRLWSDSEIIYYKKENNIAISFNRRTGDRQSASYIHRVLRETLKIKNICWQSRKHYIMLKEGIPSQTNDTKNNHMYNYLLGDDLSKEICSFI